jgi:3-deoxy-D-manno-octulosonic-acid transferase
MPRQHRTGSYVEIASVWESCFMSFWVDVASCLALLAALPRWIAGIVRGRYRWDHLAARLLGRVPPRTGSKPCLWLHAPSLGEMQVLLKLLPALEQQHAGYDFVVSSATTSGFELATRRITSHRVIWFPMAFSWAARTALKRLRPTAILFFEIELAPTLVAAAKRQGVGVYVVNGRLSQRRQRTLRAWRQTAATALQWFDGLFVQTTDDAVQFVGFGARPEAIEVTGSIKLDGSQADRNNPHTTELRRLAAIQDDETVIVAGSTKAGEEQAVLAAFQVALTSHPGLRLILAPRNASRFDEVAKLLAASGLSWQRRSRLADGESAEGAKVILVDTVGELNWWWGLADIAFVGGSLKARGGQNMIEPAAYGAAICFGPHTANFRDIVALLLAEEAAETVHNESELASFLCRCVQDPLHAEILGWRARRVVESQSGAIEKTSAAIARSLRELGRDASPRQSPSTRRMAA